MTGKSGAGKRRYWLMKSEPDAFSIRDLIKSKNQTSPWDGVRNFQARNFMRDEMKNGDGVLFYHSSVSPPGIAGEAVIAREGYPDHTAFDRKNIHYDPKSKPDHPTWYMVDVKFVRECSELIPLDKLRTIPELKEMVLLKASRLSVQPVTEKEWRVIMALPEWG